ncbi:MAG: flagellar hook-basal body complex protein FliE [Gammaproteobacteria bacterium]|nr:flagellar hook-basal body complex protein FliE [Gammaproteobacteria bacterium]
MNEINMSRMMSDLHRLAAQAQAKVPVAPTSMDGMGQGLAPGKVGQSDEISGFGSLFSKAIKEVNNTQQTAAKLKKAFEAGEPNVDLPQVMVASQKASVAFEATLEVRKHLLKVYQDVMSMQV